MAAFEETKARGSATKGLRCFVFGFWGAIVSPKPIGLYLFLLIFVTIIPALAVSLVLLERHNEAQREVVKTLTEATGGTIAEAVDRELSGMVTTLRVLSTAPALVNDDLEKFYDRAKAALTGTGTHMVLLDENLRQVMNTKVPYGTPLGQTFDAESAERALELQAATVSNVFHGRASAKWVFDAVLPVFSQGRPTRILILRRNAEDLSSVLSEQNLRGGWNAAVVDSGGVVVSSSFMSSNTGKTFFLWPLRKGWQTSTGRLSEQSPVESYQAVISESGYSGWQVVIWAPTAAVEQPMRESIRTIVVGGLLVIAIGALAAWILGRQIARPVRWLAHDAHRLGAGEMVEAAPYPITEVATVSSALAEAAADRRKAENDIRLLMREVAHRAKNQLTVVSSIAKQSARNARTFSAFQDAFQQRLQGLARSTDLLIAGAGAGVDLRELLEAQIKPFEPDDPGRLELSGPPFRLASQPAQTIGLAAHELATNASKYGAFSTLSGRLSLSWEVEGDMLHILWREHVPRMRRRAGRPGFGTEIIDRMLGGTLDAEISRTLHRDGLVCSFRIPVARLVPNKAAAQD